MDLNDQRNDAEDGRIATLCHDLRQNVAAGLMLASERPGDEALPPEVRRRLHLVVDQLRALSEALAAESDPQPRLVELTLIAAECARTAEAAHGVRVALVVDACPLVLVEPASVRRAINNLVDNAARATRTGLVEVVVRVEDGHGVVEVDDDGPGFGSIPAGAGKGLAQVRAATDAHGGRLERRSSRLGGTRFQLSIPEGDLPETAA